jgi:hypothetical protein
MQASNTGRNEKLARVWIESDLFLCQIFLEAKDFAKVQKILPFAEIEAERLELADFRLRCYSLSAEWNLAVGNFLKATQYQERFLQLRDQLYGEELLHKISALQVEFEERHQVQKIKEQDELMRLKEESLRQQRNVSVLISIICLFLIIILIFLILNFRSTRRMNLQLDFMVREKTQHLELLHSELHFVNYKRLLCINDVVTAFRATIASLKGMCNLGRIDSEASISIDKLVHIERTAIEMGSIVEPLMSHDVNKFLSLELSDREKQPPNGNQIDNQV